MTDTIDPNLSQSTSVNLRQRTDAWLEHGFTAIVWGLSLLTIALLLWMGWVIFAEAQAAIHQFGWGFLKSQEWDIGNQLFGALPFVYGTLVSSAIALVLAIPVGLAVAIITSETFLPSWLRLILSFLVELIAAIPSVIVGLWGIAILIPRLLPLQQWLFNQFGWFPLLNTEPLGPSMLVAGVVLAIMVLPTIAAISREVLLTIPSELRSASMALGATRWETIWNVLLPSARSGILGAVMLALGRALGETMAVTMVIGNSLQLSSSLLAPAYTIPAVLANQFAEALDPSHISALMYLALVLFAITLVVNIVAVLLMRWMSVGTVQARN